MANVNITTLYAGSLMTVPCCVYIYIIQQNEKFPDTVKYRRSSEARDGDAVVDVPMSTELISLVIDDNMRRSCSLSQSERDIACSGWLSARSSLSLLLPWLNHIIQYCTPKNSKLVQQPNLHAVITTVVAIKMFLITRNVGQCPTRWPSCRI